MTKHSIITIALLFLGISLNAQSVNDNQENGKLCFKKCKFDSAIVYFTKAIEQNPNITELYLDRAMVYGASGRLAEALVDYNKVIEMDSLCGKAYQGRSNVFMKRGPKDKELQDYKKAIALLPDDEKTYYCYINLSQHIIDSHGDIDTALFYVEKAIGLTKVFKYFTAPSCFFVRGKIFYQKGEYQKAVYDFTTAIDLGFKYMDCYLLRSKAYEILGLKDNAKQDRIEYETIKIKTDHKKKSAHK